MIHKARRGAFAAVSSPVQSPRRGGNGLTPRRSRTQAHVVVRANEGVNKIVTALLSLFCSQVVSTATSKFSTSLIQLLVCEATYLYSQFQDR